MEYNKRKFAKANDKKVLHKIKKQWVVVSLSLLAALGFKALATTNVSADTTTATGNTDAKQVNSSQSKSSTTLVKSQTNTNHQNDNSSTDLNRSVQGRQSMQSSVSSANIMNSASDMHQSIIRNAMAHPSSTNSVQNKSGQNSQASKSNQANQPNQEPHLTLGATAPTTSNNQKPSDQSDGTIVFKIVNNNGKNISGAKIDNSDHGKANGENESSYQVATVSFRGKHGTSYSLKDIWNTISKQVPGYSLDTNYNSENNPSYDVPVQGQSDSDQTLYVQGNKITQPVYVYINAKVANGSDGTISSVATLNNVNVGDSIDPREFLNNYQFASLFNNKGKLYPQSDFNRDANSMDPVRIQETPQGSLEAVNLDGSPYQNSEITFDYHLKSLDDKTQKGYPIIITQYFDRDLYHDSQSPKINLANNRRALYSVKNDMYNPDVNGTGTNFNYERRQDNIPAGYFYVSDIKYTPRKGDSTDSPANTITNFGGPDTTEVYNIKIAKDARLIYQDPSDGYKVMNVTMLQNMEPHHNQLNQLLNTTNDQIQNYGTNYQYTGRYQIPSGYTEDSTNQAGQAYTTSKGTKTTSTISDSGTYYINLHRKPTTLTINYINVQWPSDVVSSINFHGLYKSQLSGSELVNGKFPNAKYVKNNIQYINSDPQQKWTIPSYRTYYNAANLKDPNNNKTLSDVFDNRPYFFNDPSGKYKSNYTVKVPIDVKSDYTTKIIYEDTNNGDKQVGKPVFVTNRFKAPMRPYYENAYNNLPTGYVLDKVANSNSNDPTIPVMNDTLHNVIGQTEHIYVKSNYLDGFVNYRYFKDNQPINDENGQFINDKNNKPVEPVHHVASTVVSDKPYFADIPVGYHVDSQIPVSPKQSDWVLSKNGDNTFTVNLRRDQGTITLSYYSDNNGHHSDAPQIGQSVINTQDFGSNDFDQNHTINVHMPSGYNNSDIKSVWTSNPNSAPVKVYGDNTTQNIKVYLVKPKVTKGNITVNYLYGNKKTNVAHVTLTNPVNTAFAQSDVPKYLPMQYRDPSKYSYQLDSDSSKNVRSYLSNPQTVNIDILAKGKIMYFDPSDTSQSADGSYYPMSSDVPTIIGATGDKVNYGNYPQSNVMDQYLPKTNGNYTYQFVSDKPNAVLEPGATYDITVKRIGTINVHYVQNSDFNNSIAPTQSVTGENGTDFNWEDYIKAIPNYQFVKILHNNGTNSVNNFSTAPQDVYLDFTKVKQTPNTPVYDNGNAVITYMDINGTRIRGISKTGHEGEGIPNSMYTDNLPSGYVIDHYDGNNQNLYNGANNIVWVRQPNNNPTPQPQPIPQPTSQSSYAPAPSSASSVPSESASSASSAPSQSSVAPSSSVTPPSSKSVAPQRKSVAPQRKSTRPAHHTKRGNIGVTYEEPNGQVITQRNYSGKIGKSFAPTAPSGYHYVVVKGKNVKQFKDHRQHVIMKLVKSDYYGISHKGVSHKATASSANHRNGRTDQDLKMYSGSNRASFDHALNQEANIARNQANGKKLPQTGESQSNYVEVIGAALLMISAVFIAGYDFDMKRRRD